MTTAQGTAVAGHPAAARYLAPAEKGSCRLSTEASGTIVLGDALDVLTMLPDDSVDLVHTSPPYNIERPYASNSPDKSSVSEYVAFLTAAIGELKRVVRPGGSIFWQTGYTQDPRSQDEIIPIDFLSHQIFRDSPNSLQLWDRIIWRYWGGHAFVRKFTNKHETILWFVKPGSPPQFSVDSIRERAKEYDKRNNFWGRNPGNVWEVDRVAYGSLDQTSHIAVFPEELSERIIRSCSNPGDLVLDPFSGSGTVPKVARGLDRRWLGIEISPLYATESAVRVGFQQPSESDSLASEIVKLTVFAGREGACNVDQAATALDDWIVNFNGRQRSREFEADVETVFQDANGRNRAKREVWQKYDDLIASRVSGDDRLVAIADALLCSRYKLRKHLNGVSRYRSLLDASRCVEEMLADAGASAYLRNLAEQEPSSYALDGDLLTLVAPQPNLRHLSRQREGERAVVSLGSGSEQGRIL